MADNINRDINPNRVKRDEVDAVFIATASEVMYRRGKARKDRGQIRKANFEKGLEIVREANKKKKDKK